MLGAHPDDIEFGCGGTLNQIKDENIMIEVFSDTVNINGEGIIQELANSMKIYNKRYFVHRDIQNMSFFKDEDKIKQRLFEIKRDWNPDVVFCTSPKSVNSDHSILANSVLNVFQEQTILHYEVIRGDYKHEPNFYNELNFNDVSTKLRAIGCYGTQEKRIYSKPDATTSLLQFRGLQVGVTYAEAFEVGRFVKKM